MPTPLNITINNVVKRAASEGHKLLAIVMPEGRAHMFVLADATKEDFKKLIEENVIRELEQTFLN